MKANIGNTHFFQMEMKKVFYGTFSFGILTTFIMFVLVLSSDFLARHGLIHILLTLSGFILTICAVWAGIQSVFKSGAVQKTTDIILLFFSSMHALFVGFILVILIV